VCTTRTDPGRGSRAAIASSADEGHGAEAGRQLLADRRRAAGRRVVEGADVELEVRPAQPLGDGHHGGLAAAEDDVGKDQGEAQLGHSRLD
jgi:hypothetical protein